jgi:hypothetical protein
MGEGGTHSPADEEGGSQFGRLEKKPSTLSIVCGVKRAGAFYCSFMFMASEVDPSTLIEVIQFGSCLDQP